MKTTWSLAGRFYFYYLYDAFLVFTLLSLFYLHHDEFAPLLTFLGIYAAGAVPLLMVLTKAKKKLTYGHIILTSLFGIALSHFLGIHLLLSILLGSVINWRVYENYGKRSKEEAEAILFITMILCFSLYVLNPMFAKKEWLIGIILFQLFYFLLFKVPLAAAKSLKAKKVIVFLMIGLAGLLLFNYIKFTFLYLLSLGAKLLAFLVGPVFYYIFRKLSADDQLMNDFDAAWKKANPNQPSEIQVMIQQNGNHEWILIALIVFVIAAVCLYLFRRKIRRPGGNGEDNSVFRSILSPQPVYNHSYLRNSRPSDPARKLLYQLDQTLFKYGLGRKREETVEDWFGRMDYKSEMKREIADLYRKVRYGEHPLTKQELDVYKRNISELKKEIKRASKEK
ncbi:DUF4129 domain-containing protein [Fictibacillus sp. S7]|uniref:DUF4129 domain-containing protein n=1 Tax=Fictibacillus sp. S7 TaxID=2212476 RepID=UPI001011634E|nr:DUF4129 domain-containing protein [Fictibacillus sp. S7]RXZ01562.1 hypothetical protein DMO16_18995 [Fictibacillus sp. S7]